MTKLLLSHGADPDEPQMTDPSVEVSIHTPGSFPLARAAKVGNVRIAKLLRAHGANVNAVWGNEFPLALALLSHQSEMVKFLLSQGADPTKG
jgi:ankyrin repeat protein